jgi:hypothetical protein
MNSASKVALLEWGRAMRARDECREHAAPTTRKNLENFWFRVLF